MRKQRGFRGLNCMTGGIRVLGVSLALRFLRRALTLGAGAGAGKNWSVGSTLFRKKVSAGFHSFWEVFGEIGVFDVVFSWTCRGELCGKCGLVTDPF